MTQINKTRNGTGEITTNTETQRSCENTMGKYMPRSLNLDEIDKFLEIYNPPKLSLEEAESLKRPQVSGKGENGGKKGEGQVKEHK